MAKKDQVTRQDKVIIFGNNNYSLNHTTGEWTKTEDQKPVSCEVYDIEEIKADRILTYKHTLPLADAQVMTGTDGIYYCYNAALPYLTETAHLAEVEKNMIIGQAFLYQGRSGIPKPSNLMSILFFSGMFILALVGMFT